MSNCRVLVVDDEYQVRYATARALGRVGFDCELAADGHDALDLLGQAKYDLVVTDLRMPTFNGHKLATALLNSDRPPAIAVLTGVLEPKLTNDLSVRGVDRIFFKPVDYSRFAADLLALVQERASRCEQAYGDALVTSHTDSEGAVDKASSQPATEAVTLDGLSTADVASTNPSVEVADRLTSPLARSSPHSAERSARAGPATCDCSDWAKKIHAEVSRTQKVLQSLERAVAATQSLSYFCLAIALGAGLLSGLILGWLSSQLLSPGHTFK